MDVFDDVRSKAASKVCPSHLWRRICFRWTEAGPVDVEITDYHK